MKNKIKVTTRTSSKISLKHKLIYATSAILLLALIVVSAFVYFNVGNSEKAYAADRNYTSKDNNQGLWRDPSTWTKRDAWTTNVPQSGTWYTGEVLGYVTYEITGPTDVFTAGNGGALDITDTLFIKGDALFTSGGAINVGSTGVLIVDGDFTISGGSRLNNQGRVVVTGNLRATGGGRISNSTTGNNGFYTYGVKTQNGGGSYGANQKDEADLQINDPSLHDFVTNGGIVLLPIVLDYFTAQASPSHSIIIEWGTITEKDNDFFTLERSTDGKVFDVVTTLDAAGDSNSKISYLYEDRNPLEGFNYYRLKQTDYNGDFEYFKIINVYNSSTNNPLISNGLSVQHVGPNPFKEYITISYTSLQQDIVELQIIDMAGQILYKENLVPQIGENEHVLKTPTTLKPGLYLVNITGKETATSYRMLKI